MLWVECLSPQNLYVAALLSCLVASGVGAFGRSLGHEGGALSIGLVPLEEEACRDDLSLPGENMARKQLSADQEESLSSTLDLPVP